MAADKIINDIIEKSGSTTQAEFYPMPKGVLKMKVHAGSI